MGEQHVFQAPKGTRDLYPLEAARRRYITEAWRSASIRHGFEEIDGPTFEHLDLYTVKSGEGIVSELFSFKRFGGEKDFALRPEFTPTLARMYAARANSLPRPTKWFSTGPHFRAERPQRGRLREFLQWNLDVIGDPSPEADAEVIAGCVGCLESLGLASRDVTVKISSRTAVTNLLRGQGVPGERFEEALALLDRKDRLEPAEFVRRARQIRLDTARLDEELEQIQDSINAVQLAREQGRPDGTVAEELAPLVALIDLLDAASVLKWCEFDLSIVRGLAYYTGTVFEVIAEGERAICGGGRYDGLIELFGGPPTPAVGFGMGDVVLSLVLQDKGLMPSDTELMAAAGQRPDVFVIPVGDGTEELVAPTLAALRREGIHARKTYKATRNLGKLLKDAAGQNARLALILESSEDVTVKDLDSGGQQRHPRDLAVRAVREILA